MESEAKYALVGLIVVVFTVMVVGAVFWLSNSGAGKTHDN
jgi:ABC-type transporter Mla subunit MlaD